MQPFSGEQEVPVVPPWNVTQICPTLSRWPQNLMPSLAAVISTKPWCDCLDVENVNGAIDGYPMNPRALRSCT